ncbi:atypical kinase COQ8B, mitochondrial [Sitophilus oryzae]|uniref:Atypical kinase COQ8B, mitochondrial n=1 Tax=Sitophilus oryzae TaxID=7048 RepID=A0A6J2XIG8_SITOR|nr:atypical kinase COQ8B, mitochondrial [Sitophilus oryzae]
MSTSKDISGILRALKLIIEAQIKLQKENLDHICKTSSFKPLIRQCIEDSQNLQRSVTAKNVEGLANDIKDGVERLNVVAQGLKVYADLSLGSAPSKIDSKEHIHIKNFAIKPVIPDPVVQPQIHQAQLFTRIAPVEVSDNNSINLSKLSSNRESISSYEYQIKLTESDKKLLQRLDMEHRAKLVKQVEKERQNEQKDNEKTVGETIQESKIRPIVVPHPKSKVQLTDTAKQQKVPSSKIGRMWSFGTLAAGLSIGTAAEYLKKAFTVDDVATDGTNIMLNEANMKRIVDTLCKVRGAALKLGQILSIQDDSIINPELAKALERVRKSADFMPDWQLDQVITSELGSEWRKKFTEFRDKPFAAASIGQVHYGKLDDGREIAIKVQYPGVDKAIENDLDMLGGIMNMWNIFPKGMFLDNLMTVAKRELAWEVDYIREAICTRKFKEILNSYNEYYVPDVVNTLSTKKVLTTELLNGIPVDQCFDMDYESRHLIGEKVLDLCLLELMRFNYMQTDPNWANFLYNPTKKQLLLLDFGASREYSKEFMDKYVVILKAACDGDTDTVLKKSRDIGFLTGYESKIMEEAHVDSVMMLGEIFRTEGAYDFAQQNLTYRIQNLAQTMLVHRLCPPPEEVYSLHRKLSGVFLLLSKLKVKVNCRDKFLALYEEYIRKN